MYKETDIPLISEQYYHIYNCGNNGENLFFEERNYPYFLKLYAKYIYPVTNTYAYCLMKNHFHLLVRMKPLEDLEGFENLPGLYSRQFSNLFNAYTKAINKYHHPTEMTKMPPQPGRVGNVFLLPTTDRQKQV